MANHSVAIQITIHAGSATGAIIYQEEHTQSTNEYGLITLQVGHGSIILGELNTIDWGENTYYLEVGVDLTQGNTFTSLGTSQILSVPYALYSKTAETIASSSSSNKFYLGQDILGGIVYYIYYGSDGHQHGLIVSKTETTSKWQSISRLVNADRTDDGLYNTELMSESPAKDWITNNFSTDWYLPSTDELSLLWHNRFHVNKALRNGYHTIFSTPASYWSSTEHNTTDAFAFYFNYGGHEAYSVSKETNISVRAIRSFELLPITNCELIVYRNLVTIHDHLYPNCTNDFYIPDYHYIIFSVDNQEKGWYVLYLPILVKESYPIITTRDI